MSERNIEKANLKEVNLHAMGVGGKILEKLNFFGEGLNVLEN